MSGYEAEWISIGDELEIPCRLALRDVCTLRGRNVVRTSLAMRPSLRTVESMRHLKGAHC